MWLFVNLERMKEEFSPIDIKFVDRKAYYDAFDKYNVKKKLTAMESLFEKYLNEMLDMFLNILD